MGTRHFSGNGYDFTEEYDPETKQGTTTIRGRGENEKGTRDSVPLKSAELKAAGYEDGHGIPVAANAPKTPMNHFAQARHLNRSEYKTVENAEIRLADEKNGTSIEIERVISWHMGEEGDKVADYYMINDTVTYADGHQEEVHEAFSNLTPEDYAMMEEMDALFPEEEGTPDPVWEGMSEEEIAEIHEIADSWDSSIRADFEPSYSVSPTQTEEAPDGGLDNNDGGIDSGDGIGDDDGGGIE